MNRSSIPLNFAAARSRALARAAQVALLALGSLTAMANVLTNPGFETDAVLNNPPAAGATGWTTSGNANTASTTGDPVQTGTGSLQLAGAGGFGVPQAYQSFAATAGETWNFQGYMLTPATLPADATFGLLKIVWRDAGGAELQPGSALVGTAQNGGNPGIESTPLLNSASTPNSWIFTRAMGVAPAGTAEVRLYCLMVDQSAGTGYFDDMEATNAVPVVPPPVVINFPTNNAPLPTNNPANVLSMYNSSGTYTDHGGINWYAGWSGNPSGNADFTITNTGAVVKKYLGLSFAGVEYYSPNQVDAAGYNMLHVDVWTPNANQFGIQLVSLAGGTQAGQVNFLPAGGVITTNTWVSLNIPLSQFTSANPNLLLNNLEQLLWIDNQGGGFVNGNFYIDNVYFYSNAAPVVPPTVFNYPTNAAPTPTRPASSVVALYNSATNYSTVPIDTWLTVWSAASYSDYLITNANRVVKRYGSLNFAGVEFFNPKIDASGMTTFHMDLWTPNASKFSVKLVSFAPGGQEYEIVFTNNVIVTNTWVSLDIPISNFLAGNPAMNFGNLGQLLFINNNPGGPQFGTFFIDNVYFWSTNQVKSSISLGSQVSWTASNGNTYQPQESPNGSTWSNLGGVLSGATVANVFDATTAPFYRVVEVTSGAVNGILNGGFETSDVNPPYAANWLAAGSGGAIANPVRAAATDAYAGSSALEIEGQGTGGAGAGPVALQNSIPAAPGSVTLSFRAKGALMLGGANPQYGIFWFDASNNLLAGSGFSSFPTALNGSYQLETVTKTAPANTDHAQVQFLVAVGAGTGDHWLVRIDDVSLSIPGAPVTNILSAVVQPAAGISWSSGVGRTYQVQSSPTLAPVNWSAVGANVLGTGNNSVGQVLTTSNCFYRVLEIK